MAFLKAFLHTILGHTVEDTFSRALPDETVFARIKALVMSYVILGMLLSAIVVNFMQGISNILPYLSGLFVAQMLGLAWIYAGGQGRYVMLASSLVLMALGAYLLLVDPVGAGGSLFWFLLFPPMLILCAGLRVGGILFAFFYLFLLLMMLSPLDRHLATPYPMPVRWRFLLTMLSACAFSMLSEYARMRTHDALTQAMLRLDTEARNDSLTGLGNRRDFRDFYHWIWTQSTRNHKPCALALIDLDYFKAVNDTYGHLTGDMVLVHVANTLRSCLRGSDRVFRWGGEEFLVLLHESSRSDALRMAERLREKVCHSPCIIGDIAIPLTISIGVYCGEAKEDPDHAMAVADANMYAAKQQGRNRVVG